MDRNSIIVLSGFGWSFPSCPNGRVWCTRDDDNSYGDDALVAGSAIGGWAVRPTCAGQPWQGDYASCAAAAAHLLRLPARISNGKTELMSNPMFPELTFCRQVYLQFCNVFCCFDLLVLLAAVSRTFDPASVRPHLRRFTPPTCA